MGFELGTNALPSVYVRKEKKNETKYKIMRVSMKIIGIETFSSHSLLMVMHVICFSLFRVMGVEGPNGVSASKCKSLVSINKSITMIKRVRMCILIK